MVVNLKICLEQIEYSALGRLAEQELRSYADQIHHIVRMELIHRGFLPDGYYLVSDVEENDSPRSDINK